MIRRLKRFISVLEEDWGGYLIGATVAFVLFILPAAGLGWFALQWKGTEFSVLGMAENGACLWLAILGLVNIGFYLKGKWLESA